MSEVVDCIAWIVRKTFWSLGVFFKFLGLRLLDLIGLIFNLLACCTIVRLPHMIAGFSDMDMWGWRWIGIVQFFVFLFDIPIFIMGLFILITLWRVPQCYSELREEFSGRDWDNGYGFYYYGWEIRKVIITNFFKSCIDIFCLPLSLILLLSWRCILFCNDFKEADSDSDRRKTCFKHFFQLLLDIPLLILTIPAILSWRLPIYVYKVRKAYKNDEEWDDIRYIGFVQCFYLFLDIPCLIMFFITLVTWRCPIMLWQLSNPDDAFYRKRQQWKIRKIIALQFLYLFLDIPWIICTFFIFGTLWRIPTFIRRCKKKIDIVRNKTAFYKKEMDLRLVCLQEFCMVFIDFFCFILFVIVFFTFWRTIPLIKDIKGYLKRFSQDKKGKVTVPTENTPISPISHEAQSEEKAISSNEREVEEEADKKPTLTWSKCMTKIRKTICIHFVLLIIDIPAIPICIFLLITGLRTTRLLSDLLGGKFYMLFAVSVYYHALHFLIDVFFICLFLVLMVLRPVQVWINLLEDEDHQKHRELKEIMKWFPDIANSRHEIYQRLDDVLSLSFKNGENEFQCLSKLNNEFDDFIGCINDILEKLSKHEIEDEFVTLVQSVLFYEKQRAQKLVRLFTAEHHYLRRPNKKIRDKNLDLLNREKFEYDRKVGGVYEKLKNYTPPRVPLYESKTGFTLRSRDETKKVLIKTLPRGGLPIILGVLISCIPLYRAPKLIYRLCCRWYARFDILRETLYEYALDFLTVLRIIFVVLFLYRAPFMLADIFDCIVEKRSWVAVRKVVKEYPGFILEDIYLLIKALLSWKTPRFLLTAILFGFFMPADLFLTVGKVCTGSKCIAYMITLLLYVIFMGFPFAYSFYGAEKIIEYGLAWTNMIFISVFIGVLLFVLLTMVISLVRDHKKSFLLKMPDADYVRFNWYNIHVMIFEVLEFFQSLALIFKLTDVPMYGSNHLTEASKILLFSFLPFEAIFWITAAVFVFWFLSCGAPIIFENILEDFSIGTFGKRPSWRLTISLLANTLFLFFVENFISFSACNYEHCPSNYTLGDIPPNATCLQSTFVEDTSMQCWSEPHRDYAAFGLIGLVWYTTTALIFDTTYGDPDTLNQDIGFSPIYTTVINILKAGMVVSATIITKTPNATLVCLLVFNILSVLFTFGFKIMFKFYPCNFMSVLVWRLCTFVSSCVVAVAVLVAYAIDDPSSKTPLLIMGIGILIVFIVSLIIAIKQRHTSGVERDRELFRKEILNLEKRIHDNKWFLKGWEKRSSTWNRLMKSVREAQKLDKSLTPMIDPVATPSIQSKNQSFQTPPPLVPSSASDNSMELTNFEEEPASARSGSTVEKDVPSQDDPNPPPSPEQPTVQPPIIIESDSPTPSTTNPTDIEISIEPPPLTEIKPPPFPQDTDPEAATTSQLTPTLPPIDLGLPPPPSYEAVQNNKSYYDLHEFQADRDEYLRLEKNGRNLLVTLEKYVDYKAYKYSFFLQRDLWLNSAWNANWTSLLQCLRVLNSNLSGDFDRPSTLDLQLAQPSLDEDTLSNDPQDSDTPPPPFVRETKEMRLQRSNECRERALADVASHAPYTEEWSAIFERVLPTNGCIKSWNIQGDPKDSLIFSMELRRSVTGKITAIDENAGGNKLAIGASLNLGKKLSGRITFGSMTLNEGIVGKKGPVSLTVKSLGFMQKKNKTYIQVSDKKAALAMVLASSKEIIWE